ncbi:MAG: WG repeat-containing protein [Cyclobacteriaceae bacterium]
MERVRIIFLWLAIFSVSTSSFSNNVLPVTGMRPTGLNVFEENGKVGLKDDAGRILIPAAYSAIGWSNKKLSTVDGVVGYQTNGLWGLISISNKLVTTAEFQELMPAEGSLLIAKRKSPLSQRWSYGCINTSGKVFIPFSYDGLRIANMRAVVMVREQTRFSYGLVDLSNKIIIPLRYQSIYALGSLRYAVENLESKIGLFSDDGVQVTDFSIDSISSFKMDYAIVYQNQKQGLIDRGGEIKLEPAYREILLLDDGSIKVRQVDSWFFLDGQNKLLKQCLADSVRPISSDAYAIKVSGKVHLTNNLFKPLHKGHFSSVSPIRKGKVVFQNGNKKGLINAQGKILLTAKYNDLIINEPYLLASVSIGTKNRWVVLDSAGETLSEKNYEEIAPFNGKYFAVRNRNYWGAVNAQGKEFVACVHDSLLQQNGSHVVVKFKGNYGIINLDENWIITPQPHTLQLLDDERYFEFVGKTTFLKSLTGNIIYFSDNLLEFKGDYLLENLPTGAFWIIDLNGIISDRSYQPESAEKIFHPSEGLRAIRKDGKYGFIDDRGRLRIANRYDDVKPFSNGLAAIKIRNKWGFIDDQENIIIQPVYEAVESFRNGYAIVSQNQLFGIVSGNSKVVLPLRYNTLTINRENRFILEQDGLTGMADSKGAVIINPKYDEVTDLGNGYVIAGRNGKYGLLTLQGVSTIPMIYDGLSFDPHHQEYMGIKKAEWEVIRF